MTIKVTSLDHLVLTVRDIAQTQQWYARVLGMQPFQFGEGRQALAFGPQKINLHAANAPSTPHARVPTRGSADLCFLTDTPLDDVIRHLEDCGVPVLEGPVPRTGAAGLILSVYVRDPDENLIEISRRMSSD